ncbi:MAG: (2Fe-2S)-binding protein [Aminivibrio sp.]|nr:(2Fe-2S)-binding protein [Aminivibrio sp.]
MMKRDVHFILNGRPVTFSVEPRTTLLRALREYGVTSVKRGCEEGECGTCTVVIDDLAQKSCMILALEAEGKSVLTVEGLVGPKGELHPIQQAFVDEGAIQCGFCTPGMIMSAYAFLRKNPDPTEEDIRVALAGNLCRCTGYIPIFRAVQKAAAVMRELGHIPGRAR